MNVFTLFEQRIDDIFDKLPSGIRPAIKFRKVGKDSVREMKKSLFLMDGEDTVAALYTVLLSAEDEQAMRPVSHLVAQELSMLVASQAEERGYAFVGEPLARFIVDEGVKPKRFAVIADNVDKRTLDMLRRDEDRLRSEKPQSSQRKHKSQRHPEGKTAQTMQANHSRQSMRQEPLGHAVGMTRTQGRPQPRQTRGGYGTARR